MTKIDQLIKEKNNAYWERNQLVSVLSKFFPSYLTKHSELDKDWESDWRTIVVINIPIKTEATFNKGQIVIKQVTWHIHDSEVGLFDHLQYQENKWDGHTTEEKYKRLRIIDIKESFSFIKNYMMNKND